MNKTEHSQTEFSTEQQMLKFGGFWRRLGAGLIDILALVPVFILLGALDSIVFDGELGINKHSESQRTVLEENTETQPDGTTVIKRKYREVSRDHKGRTATSIINATEEKSGATTFFTEFFELEESHPDFGGKYQVMGGLIESAIFLTYFTLMWSSKYQTTLGGKVLGIRVTDQEGHQISWLRALGRFFAANLSALIFGIGFIMIAFTSKKRGLHDMICKTYVFHGPTPPELMQKRGGNC